VTAFTDNAVVAYAAPALDNQIEIEGSGTVLSATAAIVGA
jgi:hypothetical protein